MVAGAAGLDAAGTGEAGADHAADGSELGRAEQRRGIDRLECKLLVFGIDQRLYVGQRRARLHGDDQLVRLIGGHCAQRREVEHGIGRHRLADQPLRAVANDLERLLARDRLAHRLLDILGIAYFESVHAFLLAFPALAV